MSASNIVSRAGRIALLSSLLLLWSARCDASCGETYSAAPAEMYTRLSGDIAIGSEVSINALAGRSIFLELDTSSNLRLYTLSITKEGTSYPVLCSDGGSIRPSLPVRLKLTEVPYGAPVTLRIGNIGNPGNSYIRYKILVDLNPSLGLTATDIVRRKIYIYIFENAPLASSARARVEAALTIWRSVGVDFTPIYRTISGNEVVAVLGADKILEGFVSGTFDSETGEWQDRARAQALKPNPDALGVFFAKGNKGLIGSTRADAGRFQVYIDEDAPGPPPVGRTVAHEIGHLLLGEGHTDSHGPWTSGLMRAAPSTALDIPTPTRTPREQRPEQFHSELWSGNEDRLAIMDAGSAKNGNTWAARVGRSRSG